MESQCPWAGHSGLLSNQTLWNALLVPRRRGWVELPNQLSWLELVNLTMPLTPWGSHRDQSSGVHLPEAYQDAGAHNTGDFHKAGLLEPSPTEVGMVPNDFRLLGAQQDGWHRAVTKKKKKRAPFPNPCRALQLQRQAGGEGWRLARWVNIDCQLDRISHLGDRPLSMPGREFLD